MKRIFALLIIFVLVLNTYAFADGVDINGEGALLIDADSGRVLYEKNSHKKLYPASTTKMMTAILAIEYGKMDEMVLVDKEVVNLTKGSHIALDYDEEVRFEDLINALMIASANDAALALGKHISGSIDGFVEMMNQKARELGAVNTHFMNPNGLHDDDHYTTPYDLYLIADYAMKNELFKEIVGKSSYVIPPTNKKEERLMHTTNKFLYGSDRMYLNGQLVPIKYEGISGIKTGTTGEAKNCLVSFAQKNGRNIYTVVLKASGKEVYADTIKLMDYGFNNFNTSPIAYGNEFIDNVDVVNGNLPYISAVLDKNIYYTLSQDESSAIERKVKFKDEIIAPVSKGDSLGSIEYYLNGEIIAEGNIVSTLSVGVLPSVKLIDLIIARWYLLVFALWFAYRLLVLLNRRSKRKRRRTSNYYV